MTKSPNSHPPAVVAKQLELTNLKNLEAKPQEMSSPVEPGNEKPTKKHLKKGALMNMNFPCPTKLLRVMPGSARARRCSYHRSN
jgi:hypothetical protein